MATACCPRCGYDLSGVVASWGDRCPLRGVCSECGLEVDWGWVLDDGKLRPRWLVEHAFKAVGVLKASLRNGREALDGRRWWRRVRMEHEVRPWRLIAHWVVWAAVFVLAAVLVGGISGAVYSVLDTRSMASAWNVRWPQTPSWGERVTWWWRAGVSGALHPWIEHHGWWVYQAQPRWNTMLASVSAFTWLGVFVAGFALVPRTLMRAGVKWVHLARGVGCFAPVFAAGACLWLVGDRAFGAIESQGNAVRSEPIFGTSGPSIMLTTMVVCWWLLWWRRFAVEYLRLPRGSVVVAALGVIATLAVLVLIDKTEEPINEWWWRLLHR